jgi:hypothetical protein
VLHCSGSFFNNAFDSSTPSCVKDAYGFVFYIHEDHGKTVSGLDTKQKARNIGDEAIANEWFSGNIRNAVYQIGMDLT